MRTRAPFGMEPYACSISLGKVHDLAVDINTGIEPNITSHMMIAEKS
jgi:hypothetical protein